MPVAALPHVHMWYAERGHGDPCVLLHPGGAGIDSRALDPNLDALARVFRVYTPEQRAHGRTPDVDGPVSYELMARDTIMFIEQVIGRSVHIAGCSDGAVVGLMIAWLRPDLVRRLVFLPGPCPAGPGAREPPGLSETFGRSRNAAAPKSPSVAPGVRMARPGPLRSHSR